MAIAVQYFNKSGLDVVDRLLISVVVKDGSALGLYASLKTLLGKRGIPLQNIIGLEAHNYSSIMEIKNGLQKSLKKDDLPLVFVMGSVCHSFALCASHAITVLPSYL